jgi:hypothetical protein
MEELYKEFKKLKTESQTKYLEYREPNDPPFSKLVTEIDQVFQTKRKQKIAKLYEAFYSEGLVDKKIKNLEAKVEKLKNPNGNKVKTYHYWVTINPEEKILLKDLKSAVDKLTLRSFIEKYMYVIEQRGSNRDEIGKGKHVHIYFKIHEDKYQVPSKIIELMKSTLKKVVNVNTKALWIQILREEYVKDKILYMIDKNIDNEHKDKQQKQEMDQIYREINNLDNYYTNMEEDLLTEPFINSG